MEHTMKCLMSLICILSLISFSAFTMHMQPTGESRMQETYEKLQAGEQEFFAMVRNSDEYRQWTIDMEKKLASGGPQLIAQSGTGSLLHELDVPSIEKKSAPARWLIGGASALGLCALVFAYFYTIDSQEETEAGVLLNEKA